MDLHIVMGWPQWVYVAALALNVCVAAVKNGEPQGDYDIRAALVGSAISVFVATCGGFFG